MEFRTLESLVSDAELFPDPSAGDALLLALLWVGDAPAPPPEDSFEAPRFGRKAPPKSRVQVARAAAPDWQLRVLCGAALANSQAELLLVHVAGADAFVLAFDLQRSVEVFRLRQDRLQVA